MDSIPIIVLTGQVPTFMIGSDAFQEADTVGITRPCTKHNWLVKETDATVRHVARGLPRRHAGRPGPVLVDIPKDVQFATDLHRTESHDLRITSRKLKATWKTITELGRSHRESRTPMFYTGGGVINSGPQPASLLRELVRQQAFPITSTLMGLGAYPASGENWLGMLGHARLYEANMAMHDCDLMINIGARFDDRITGGLMLSARSRQSAHRHRPVSINKVIRVDIPIVGDVGHVLEDLLKVWKARGRKTNAMLLSKWWGRSTNGEGRLPEIRAKGKVIKPQYALARLEALTKDMTATSRRKLASTRCGPRSILGLKIPTAG